MIVQVFGVQLSSTTASCGKEWDQVPTCKAFGFFAPATSFGRVPPVGKEQPREMKLDGNAVSQFAFFLLLIYMHKDLNRVV